MSDKPMWRVTIYDGGRKAYKANHGSVMGSLAAEDAVACWELTRDEQTVLAGDDTVQVTCAALSVDGAVLKENEYVVSGDMRPAYRVCLKGE